MIDCHTHVFPPKVSSRVTSAIGQKCGYLPAGEGSIQDLKNNLDRAGLQGAICCSAALKPEQMIPANSWMIKLRQQEPRLIPLGTIHPLHPQWPQELNRLEQHQVKGLKIHPDLAGIPLSSPAWEPFWSEVQDRFMLLVHMGPSQPGGSSLSRPRDLANILDRHPKLRVIAAHLGGLGQWDETIHTLAGRNVYFDTAGCSQSIPEHTLGHLIAKHGPKNIVFGSDYPIFAPAQELINLERLLAPISLSITTLLANGTQLAAKLDPKWALDHSLTSKNSLTSLTPS